jgi:L-2-hydroxycarboxylate dehydrogenase (NAD+)
MIATPPQTPKITVEASKIRKLVTAVLLEYGADEREASIQANMLTEADLRGQHSHGLQRLKVLVGRIQSRALRAGTRPQQTWLAPGVLRVDGRQGFGPVVAFDTLEILAQRARENGLAMGVINNSNHIGMLALYAEWAAGQGQIAIVFTTSEALVHPWGGSQALIGTNPIAVGIPTTGEPFVLDMATAEVSMGKVLSYAARGESIPLGWAIGPDGKPTTDPSSVVAVSPFGGAKGYALGLTIELLVAGLTQSAFGANVHGTLDTDLIASKGDLIIMISPDRLGLADLPTRVQEYLDELRDSPPSSPGVPVLVPGDRAREHRARSLQEGVILDEPVWADACALLTQSITVSAET